MPIPLKLIDRSRLLTFGLSEHIRERTEKLSHFFNRVKGCLVTVDGPGDHPLKGRIRVRISVRVPGSSFNIDRQSGQTLPAAIRESFDAADQRLEDYVRLSRAATTAKRRAKRDV